MKPDSIESGFCHFYSQHVIISLVGNKSWVIRENVLYPQTINRIHELLNPYDVEDVFEYLGLYKKIG